MCAASGLLLSSLIAAVGNVYVSIAARIMVIKVTMHGAGSEAVVPGVQCGAWVARGCSSAVGVGAVGSLVAAGPLVPQFLETTLTGPAALVTNNVAAMSSSTACTCCGCDAGTG